MHRLKKQESQDRQGSQVPSGREEEAAWLPGPGEEGGVGHGGLTVFLSKGKVSAKGHPRKRGDDWKPGRRGGHGLH